MFNLGPMELAVILVLALLVFGPKKLPEIGKGVGQAMREFKRASRDLMDSFHDAMDDRPRSVPAVDSYQPPTSSEDTPYPYEPPGTVATTDEPPPAGGESYTPEAPPAEPEHGEAPQLVAAVPTGDDHLDGSMTPAPPHAEPSPAPAAAATEPVQPSAHEPERTI